jgi:hypothetical protein
MEKYERRFGNKDLGVDVKMLISYILLYLEGIRWEEMKQFRLSQADHCYTLVNTVMKFHLA